MEEHQDSLPTPATELETEAPRGDSPLQENETQRLHRLVLPMILDILRTRGERSRSSRVNRNPMSNFWDSLTGAHDNERPEQGDSAPSSDQPAPDNMLIDGDGDANVDRTSGDNAPAEDHPMTDQQGQWVPSPAAAPSPPSRRSRYRLVVYFEERDLTGDNTNHENEETSPLLPPSDSPPENAARRPSRYVAVFSIDSDAQNMPIIHSAGLQQSPSNFDDILNQLFASYMPKGTPPAKKEIIDALPTATHTQHACASQPKCAVCLEEFAEGSEVVVLPCSHRFHGEECVKPWLRMHNSCPICRYEMPVDDAEYEEKRKERMAKRVIPATGDSEDLPNAQQEVVVDEPPLL